MTKAWTGYRTTKIRKALSAFTMAEILLSLTIIGVVAAITLPSLTGNINERTWNTQRKALYARMSQAVALMPALNGYGTLKEASSAGASDAVDTAAETFITDGLAKVLKINNICDNEHLEDCGIPSRITNLQGSIVDNLTTSYATLVKYNTMFQGGSWSTPFGDSGVMDYYQIDTKAAAFETANGESILVYYNPTCSGAPDLNLSNASQAIMCANFVYDLNGNKGPNTVGKDIGFMSAIYPSDSVIVAPMPLNNVQYLSYMSQFEAIAYCKNIDSESRLPNLNEASSMFYNRRLLGVEVLAYWTSSLVSSNGSIYAWRQSFDTGNRTQISRDESRGSVWCVKR